MQFQMEMASMAEKQQNIQAIEFLQKSDRWISKAANIKRANNSSNKRKTRTKLQEQFLKQKQKQFYKKQNHQKHKMLTFLTNKNKKN